MLFTDIGVLLIHKFEALILSPPTLLVNVELARS